MNVPIQYGANGPDVGYSVGVAAAMAVTPKGTLGKIEPGYLSYSFFVFALSSSFVIEAPTARASSWFTNAAVRTRCRGPMASGFGNSMGGVMPRIVDLERSRLRSAAVVYI